MILHWGTTVESGHYKTIRWHPRVSWILYDDNTCYLLTSWSQHGVKANFKRIAQPSATLEHTPRPTLVQPRRYTRKVTSILAKEVTAILYYRVDTWNPRRGYNPHPDLVRPPVDILPPAPVSRHLPEAPSDYPKGTHGPPISFLDPLDSTLTRDNIGNQGPAGHIAAPANIASQALWQTTYDAILP
eukprot:g25694.t1